LNILDFAALTFGSLIAVLEPSSTTAVYAALTKDMDSEEKKRIIRRSVIVSFVVLFFCLDWASYLPSLRNHFASISDGRRNTARNGCSRYVGTWRD